MRHALNDPEALTTYEWILRGVDHKAEIGQTCAKVVVVLTVYFWISHFLGAAFQAVLTDNNRAALSGAEVLGYEQNSVGKNFRPNVQRDFVATESGRIVYQSGARIEGKGGRGEPPENFLPNVVALRSCAFSPTRQ